MFVMGRKHGLVYQYSFVKMHKTRIQGDAGRRPHPPEPLRAGGGGAASP